MAEPLARLVPERRSSRRGAREQLVHSYAVRRTYAYSSECGRDTAG